MVIIAGCSKSKGPSYQYAVEGDWRHTKYEVILDNATNDFLTITLQYNVSLKPDGTIYVDNVQKGTYERVDENTMKFTQNGSTSTWAILTLNDSTLVIRSTDLKMTVCQTTCIPVKQATEFLKRL